MIKNVEGLWQGLWLARIDELRRAIKKETIPFPDLFQKLCRNFQIDKHLCQRFLTKLWEECYIEIISCHGVKLSEHGEAALVYIDECYKKSF